MATRLRYKITQDGITALREKYSEPRGDWAHRYAHILLSDFVNLHPDGLEKAEIAAFYGTIGLSHFEELHRQGYFRAVENGTPVFRESIRRNLDDNYRED